jgi:hypothetical protein
MKFLSALRMSPYLGCKDWCLIKDFIFEYRNTIFTVPKGFITDGASVPRIFWNALSPWGIYSPAAVGHDWLYYDQSTTKDFADEALLDGMKVLGTPILESDIIYEAVSHFGQSAWDENKKKKEIGFIRVAQDIPTSVMDTPFYWEGATGDWKKG